MPHAFLGPDFQSLHIMAIKTRWIKKAITDYIGKRTLHIGKKKKKVKRGNAKL